MRPSRVLVVTAALSLAAAMSALPVQVASAQPPSTAVLVPSNNATVSGTQVILDASASPGVTQVQFELTGDNPDSIPTLFATATPTEYGWIASWNSTTVATDSYSLQSVATEGGSSTTSPAISITVDNPPPSVSIVLPSEGATVSGTVVLDAVTSPPGVTNVDFTLEAPGCPTHPPSLMPVCDLGNATPTIYGWLLVWNSDTVPNGAVAVAAEAQYGGGNENIPAFMGFNVANPAPTVVVPANGSTVSGTQVLDCVPPSFTEAPVSFSVTGPGEYIVGDATQTYYGWLYEWNTTSVPNGVYAFWCSATYANGGSGSGASISVTVAN
jgi:hypothetical protein